MAFSDVLWSCLGKWDFFIRLSLTSRTSPNAQPIQTVSSVRDLGLFLNAGFSANDNVARTAVLPKKTVECFFT